MSRLYNSYFFSGLDSPGHYELPENYPEFKNQTSSMTSQKSVNNDDTNFIIPSEQIEIDIDIKLGDGNFGQV